MKIKQLFVSAAAWVSPTLAALATFSPVTGINYAVGIPSSTYSSSGGGDIFVSVSFPAKYQYVAIGIGNQMAGSSIFVVYTDGKGNVTVSPRDGLGHFEPLLDSSKTVTILSGSKADTSTVVANFQYRATESLLKVQSSASPFIGSWKEGTAFDTTDLSHTLDQHDDHSSYKLNLKDASVGASSNPFLGGTATQSVGQGSQSAGEGASLRNKFLKAHGSLMGVAWLVVYPAGAVLMRLRWGGVWTHILVQVLGTSMVIAGFGVGYTFARSNGLLFNNTHTILGASVFGLILLQPVLGVIHHFLYRRDGRRTLFGLAHCWYGRAVIILAVINGGLGLQLARNTRGGEIAYGVVAGVALLVYLGTTAYSLKTNKTQEKDKEEPRGV